MKRKLISILLILSLALSCAPESLAASRYAEADSAQAFAETLAHRTADPARVLLRSGTLSDDHGAQRVVRYAARQVFVLEFETEAEAILAHAALAEEYGPDRCWLDTPELGATVLDQPDDVGDADPTPGEEPTDPPAGYTARSWGAAAMGLEAFKNDPAVLGHTAGRTVTVAVLDTGADMDTEVLRHRAISPDSYDFVNGSHLLSDVTRGDAAGHGTMVATLLDDLLPENAELMLLRVFDDNGSASSSRVFAALDYALEHGADVINMSLGWEGADSSYSFLNEMLDLAYARGVPVICAAGNKSRSVDTCYPANYRFTIAVSAVGRSLRYELFSNYGDKVDFAAPGSDISSIGLGNAVMISRGTSFAAPHLTALVADMLLLREDFTSATLYESVRRCAEDLGDEGRDRLYGWGLPRLGSFAADHIVHSWDAGRTAPLASFGTKGLRAFTCAVCGETRTEEIPATAGNVNIPFIDVSPDVYYAAAVTWATANAVTDGYSDLGPLFAPELSCTRAQMVTFLWRAAGSPAPETPRSPFLDMQDETLYYYQAVLWAVEQGVTDGVDDDHFAPDDTVTRAQTVTFLWRMAGRPDDGIQNPFLDVAETDYFHDAVLWAVRWSITDGVDNERFAPNDPCTRAQIVTLLYRDLGA